MIIQAMPYPATAGASIPTFVAAASSESASTSTVVLTLPVEAVADDLAIVSYRTTNRSINAVTGWTAHAAATDASAGYRVMSKTLTAADITAGSVTATILNGPTSVSALMAVFRNAAIHVVSGLSTSGSNTLVITSVTTTVPDTYLVSVMGISATRSPTPPTGMTTIASETGTVSVRDHFVAFADAVQSAAGATLTKTWSWTSEAGANSHGQNFALVAA